MAAVGCAIGVAVLGGANFAGANVAPVETEKKTRSSVLLVTFDTTRADRIGAYGYAPAVTPTLDGIAKRGILFESAVSATPVTLPSHVSILTGTYPSAHGVHDNGLFFLKPAATLISEVFQKNGWQTAAFVGVNVLDARYGLDQGFDRYRAPEQTYELGSHQPRRPANEVVDDAIAWLDQLDRAEPFFAWVHFFDPHRPLPSHDSQGAEIERPYDKAISFCDQQLGRLIKALDERGLSENLLTVVTADHGESNGEHGERTHAIFLYQAVMRVPLIIAGGPVADRRGVRRDDWVSNAAIAPTLLHLTGLAGEQMPEVRMQPLLSREREESIPARPSALYLHSLHPYYSLRWHALRGVLWDGYKLVQGSEAELYALKSDPGELRDIANQQPARVSDLSARLDRLLAEHAPLGWAQNRRVSEGESELLASLGYVAGADDGEDPFDLALPDPRQRIGDVDLSSAIDTSLEQWNKVASQYTSQRQRREKGGHFLETAHTLVLELQRRNPRDPRIPLLLGAILNDFGNVEGAIPPLERAVRERPMDPNRHAHLAESYKRVGRPDDAVAELKIAIELFPWQPIFYKRLIGIFLDAGKTDEALAWMERFGAVLEADSPQQLDAKRWIEDQKRVIRESGAGSP
jgi:arylsulfatase A-like enzyme